MIIYFKCIIRNNLIPYQCAECGLKDLWNNKKLSLQLEHKNGIPNDNRLENLQMLSVAENTQKYWNTPPAQLRKKTI